MRALTMFVAAAEKFVKKVESGNARSKETYADMKAALDQFDAERGSVVTAPLITKNPEEITLARLECVVMPTGEILCAGKSIGFVEGKRALGKFLTRVEP